MTSAKGAIAANQKPKVMWLTECEELLRQISGTDGQIDGLKKLKVLLQSALTKKIEETFAKNSFAKRSPYLSE